MEEEKGLCSGDPVILGGVANSPRLLLRGWVMNSAWNSYSLAAYQGLQREGVTYGKGIYKTNHRCRSACPQALAFDGTLVQKNC